MLRTLYAHGSSELKEVLSGFALKDAELVDVKLFRMLTPDSFIWKLRFTDGIYYLYAEDYVPNLQHIQTCIDEVTNSQKGHFIAVKHQKAFEELSPVQAATAYQPPEKDGELARYGSDSGYDKVFLYRIDELNDEDKAEL